MPTSDLSRLPQASGLDVARGLRMFGGQAAVYREALQDFIKLYAAGLAGVDTYLEKPTDEHLGLAQREVHGVGGASAALGATVIEALAREFEAQVRRRPGPAADLAVPLAALQRELAVLISALRRQLEGT